MSEKISNSTEIWDNESSASGTQYKQSSACSVWDATVKAEGVDTRKIQDFLSDMAGKWVFQLEKGAETGYLHYQVRYCLKLKQTKNGNMTQQRTRVNQEVFRWAAAGIQAHLSPTSKNAAMDASKRFSYVMKEETRVEGPWSDENNYIKVPKQWECAQFWPFQEQILDFTFEKRHINVIVDDKGGRGKSTTGFYVEKKGGIYLPPVNDQKDIMQYVMSIMESRKMDEVPCIVMDMPRASNQERLYGVYAALEQLKNGRAYDLRNRARTRWFDSPNIWVFSNTWPERDLLSADRWKVWAIDENNSLKLLAAT